jgi:hypothetical protein
MIILRLENLFCWVVTVLSFSVIVDIRRASLHDPGAEPYFAGGTVGVVEKSSIRARIVFSQAAARVGLFDGREQRRAPFARGCSRIQITKRK